MGNAMEEEHLAVSKAASVPVGQAADMVPEVYEELRRLAGQMMARRAPGQTLQATALVHEAFLRLSRIEPQPWQSKPAPTSVKKTESPSLPPSAATPRI